MKVILINPTLEWEKKIYQQTLPLGIAYIAAVLENKGVDVKIIDCRHDGGVPLEKLIPMDADVVGFSAFTFQFPFALEICKKLKRKGFQGCLVFGGPHVSALPMDVIQYEAVDAVFVGESEKSFPLYLDYLNGKIKAESLVRTYIFTSDGIIQGEDKSWIEDLDDLPFPARHLFPLSKIMGGKDRHVNIVSTRGCPYNCTFCQPMKRTLFGPAIRRRSVGNILLEIKDCIEKYNITNFGFVDDTFTFNKNYLMEFCESLMQSGIKLQWSCQTRSDLDLEVLKLMKKSGCASFWIGIESGSQSILDEMKKKTTVEKNKEFLENCRGVGITTLVNMMVGYPGETEEDLGKSVDFINETNPDQVVVSQVTPFPGTAIYNRKDTFNMSFEDVTRNVFAKKFKSMAYLQEKIVDAASSMSRVLKDYSAGSISKEEISGRLSAISLADSKIYIFGTALIGKTVATILKKKGRTVFGYFDNYFSGTVNGAIVEKPFKPEGNYSIILASITYKTEMRKQLENLGVLPEKIFEIK